MNELRIYDDFAPLAHMGKSDIKALAQRQIDYVKESGDSENTAAFIKKIQVLLDEVQNGIKESAIDSVGRGSNYFHGVKMQISSITTYDYKKDAVWVDLKRKLTERETFLKGLKEPITVLNEETGEITTAYPPNKKVSDYIKFDF